MIARAADDAAALEDQRLIAPFGEIERGDESVVAAAENDDVASSAAMLSFAPFHLSGFRGRRRGPARP